MKGIFSLLILVGYLAYVTEYYSWPWWIVPVASVVVLVCAIIAAVIDDQRTERKNIRHVREDGLWVAVDKYGPFVYNWEPYTESEVPEEIRKQHADN